MAKFKVNDRVRIIRSMHAQWTVGRQATITGFDGKAVNHETGETWQGYDVTIDGVGPRGLNDDGVVRHFCYRADCLAPLTPPAADAWALAKVLQVTKPQHTEPVVQKEKV